MRKLLAIAFAVFALMRAVPSLAQCEGGGAAAPVAAPANQKGMEYAKGQPKTFEIEDNGDVKQVSYIKAGPYAIFEGDIVIGDANQIEFAAQSGPIRLLYRSTGGAFSITPFGYVARSVLSGAQKWTNNVVPYVIDPQLPGRDVVLQSMSAWSTATKIKFQERTAANASQYPNYVYFTIGSNPNACLSMGVGMMGGKQNVELVDGCGFGQIVHEIGHVIGLHHEQNRADRDSNVKVQLSNIMLGYGGQFAQQPAAYADAGAYDFDSIMHYEADAFSCNGQPTIVPVKPLPPGAILGQRDHISKEDAAVINSIYK
jgi:hypothetical protein